MDGKEQRERETDSLDTRTLYEQALDCMHEQRNSDALLLLNRVLELNRRDAQALYARAVTNLSMSNFRKAGCDLLKTIAVDPGFLEAYKHLGFVQLTLGKEEEALKTLQKALDIDPGYAGVYGVIGDTWLDLGEYEKAKEAFESALRLEPESVESHYKIAMYYLSRGDMAGLKKEYEILKTLDAEMAEQIGSLYF
ncbi:tetratricopeptide repeat protein [Candidatus Chlorobium masyuteum]|uniref:tetratricopeptide repeat protein n=1 Tax=Candidatus Chlorobium masyuteum TaxID=2716876 RepID=UPI001F46F8B7|nr:tetratricopeptide repeat protein [Candidatus Chlorobium masyuteum]